MIRFQCPTCGKHLGIPEIHAGKRIWVQPVIRREFSEFLRE